MQNSYKLLGSDWRNYKETQNTNFTEKKVPNCDIKNVVKDTQKSQKDT